MTFTSLNSKITGLVSTQSKNLANTTSVASGSTKRFDMPIARSGYTPIAIAGITGTGTTGLLLQEYFIYNSEYAYIYMKNITDNAVTPSEIRVYITYIKN